MVRDGYYYALGLLAVAFLLWRFTGSTTLGLLPVVLALFFLWFFRDPSRTVPTGEGEIVSPADGKVTDIDWIETPDGSRLRLSVFLNVFDVHVNRSPVGGTVASVVYKQGAFMNAMRPESNVVNEQNLLVIEGGNCSVQVKQIAGLLARRIVCWVKPGDQIRRGERFGLIKFGSRVDVLMPADVTLRVQRGDRVKGGSTVLAVVSPPNGCDDTAAAVAGS